MSEVTRYILDSVYCDADPDGSWVLYDEHKQCVADLERQLTEARVEIKELKSDVKIEKSISETYAEVFGKTIKRLCGVLGEFLENGYDEELCVKTLEDDYLTPKRESPYRARVQAEKESKEVRSECM